MIYAVIVKPGSKKGPLVVEGSGGLTVFLRERAMEGKANAALTKVLAEYFGVAKSQITIKTGARGRKKLVEIKTVV